MNAGQLQHRVTLQEAVETQDGSGDPVVAWTTVGTFWAAVEPLRGREATYAGEQVLAEMDTRIRCRYGPLTKLITAKHRLTHQGNPFDIVSIAQTRMEQREIEILAKSGVSDG